MYGWICVGNSAGCQGYNREGDGMKERFLSYGAGMQTFALLVMAEQWSKTESKSYEYEVDE